MKSLEALLEKATTEQLAALLKVIDLKAFRSPLPNEIVRAIKWLHRDIFTDIYVEVFGGKSESYAEVLSNILGKLGTPAPASIGCEALEGKLAQKVFGSMWDSLTESQKVEIAKRIEMGVLGLHLDTDLKRAGGIAGLLAMANVGGFGTYMLASSSLAGVSGLVGITLPFAAYTALSSAMAVVLGPVGWTSAALYGLYKLSGTNYQKLIPVALYIAALRYELTHGNYRKSDAPNEFDIERWAESAYLKLGALRTTRTTHKGHSESKWFKVSAFAFEDLEEASAARIKFNVVVYASGNAVERLKLKQLGLSNPIRCSVCIIYRKRDSVWSCYVALRTIHFDDPRKEPAVETVGTVAIKNGDGIVPLDLFVPP